MMQLLLLTALLLLQCKHIIDGGGTGIDNDVAHEYFLRGNDLYRNHAFDQSVEMYKQATQLNPNAYPYWTNLGHALLESGKIIEAITAYKQSLQVDDRQPRSWYNLGRAYQQTTPNLLVEAVACYDRSIALDANFQKSHYNKGLALQELGSLAEAKESYRLAFPMDDAVLNFCNILFSEIALEDAENCYLDLVQRSPTYVRGLVNLASLYQSQIQGQLLSSPPPAPHNIDKGHRRRMKDGGMRTYEEEAARLYRAALDLDPQNVMAIHGLASVLAASSSSFGSGISGEGYAEADEGTGRVGMPDPVGLSEEYVKQLFDSYAFHFDTSLAGLGYQSHILVAKAVTRHLRRCGLEGIEGRESDDCDGMCEQDAKREGRGAGLSTGAEATGEGAGGGGRTCAATAEASAGAGTGAGSGTEEVLGLDLGAGTGLVCAALEAELGTLSHARVDPPGDGSESDVSGTETDSSGTAAATSSQGSPSAVGAPPTPGRPSPAPSLRLGMIGVDLSPKMLKKARQRGCYGDLVEGDVTTFLREYAGHACPCREKEEWGRGKERRAVGEGEGKGQGTNRKGQDGRVPREEEGRGQERDADAEGDERILEGCSEGCPNATSAWPEEYPLLDFVVAADVFMYLGDLKPVLQYAKRVVRPETGVVVFTVESLDALTSSGTAMVTGTWTEGGAGGTGAEGSRGGAEMGREAEAIRLEGVGEGREVGESTYPPFALQPSGRIAHSRRYLESVAAALGYTVLELSRQIPRHDRGQPVQGYLVVLAV